ncbi:MAG: zf-HC2 domain-containing protein [Deltaproteobacteria bacterium]|nr:zf-HC2 domain-containing protein [Deltaproteobacteria bacterium]
MDCSRIKDAIYLFLDNEMGEEVASEFENHLASCPSCARRRDFTTRWLVQVRRRAVRLCAPDSLRQKVLRSLRSNGLERLSP